MSLLSKHFSITYVKNKTAMTANKNLITYFFHTSYDARKKYNFDTSLFSLNGNIIIADFYSARVLAQKINEVRSGDSPVTAGQINALGLLHEIFHYAIRIYEDEHNPGVFSKAIHTLKSQLGEKNLQKVLLGFIQKFPPLNVYKGNVTAEEYLQQSTGNKANSEIILEEIFLLHLENINQAFLPLKELYDDTPLVQQTPYVQFLIETEKFFEKEKPFGEENLSLTSFLKQPILTNPYNIDAQLEFIMSKWSKIIPSDIITKLLKSVDLIKEDAKLFMHPAEGGTHTGVAFIPSYKEGQTTDSVEKKYSLSFQEYLEYEHFTEDTHWMPEVVMIAKNTYVWLEQLSKRYQKPITRLDEVPDEELDILARWNFTAIWLIGVWERSSASQKIKQATGNPEAASSAYSLFDYVVAGELGGEPAFQNLKYRAWLRGIRIASDMVPNHTGIFSKWIIENPDHFIQSSRTPFPNYTFTGMDLSDNPDISIRIEDKYYSRSDAAVVFQRVDNRTGETRYIYHGNDGTNMPWNDTAQLNLLKPEVRESLIQTIMHVARQFPIIRFDAAMTLTKKHYQRLWFPQPGTGGDIPSRADFAMTREEFDNAMPNEFWREVVDRINNEMPNTLLLAEAFWLMEGYFVRTLGMHRVYNSAFMHMLMKEENDRYKTLIKNTLEFNPEILKRYVNFMSNPDEETAVRQFGKDDKYIGICIMMVTLPGLPMFGHGQVEGFAEKYGMEYRKSYYTEFPDLHLIRRHEEEIFPLMQKRHLFSQVEHFELYDVYNGNGNVNENVFAYSNISGDERALIIYNNSYNSVNGWINFSTGKVHSSDEKKNIYRKKLSEALQFKYDDGYFYILKEHQSNLEYLIPAGKLLHNGFHFNLQGYKYKAFINIREVYDTNGDYKRLYEQIGDEGVPSVENVLQEMNLTPIHYAMQQLFNSETFHHFDNYCFQHKLKEDDNTPLPLKIIIGKYEWLLSESKKTLHLRFDVNVASKEFERKIRSIKKIEEYLQKVKKMKRQPKWFSEGESSITIYSNNGYLRQLEIFFIFIALDELQKLLAENNHQFNNIEKLVIEKPLQKLFAKREFNNDTVLYSVEIVKTLLSVSNLFDKDVKEVKSFSNETDLLNKEIEVFKEMFSYKKVKSFIKYNEYDEKKYFSKEQFELLLDWITTSIIFRVYNSKSSFTKSTEEKKYLIDNVKYYLFLNQLLKKRANESGYVIEEFLSIPEKIERIKKKPVKTTVAGKKKTEENEKTTVSKVKKKKENKASASTPKKKKN